MSLLAALEFSHFGRIGRRGAGWSALAVVDQQCVNLVSVHGNLPPKPTAGAKSRELPQVSVARRSWQDRRGALSAPARPRFRGAAKRGCLCRTDATDDTCTALRPDPARTHPCRWPTRRSMPSTRARRRLSAVLRAVCRRFAACSTPTSRRRGAGNPVARSVDEVLIC